MSVSAASPMPNSEAAVVAALVSCLAFAVGSRKQVLAGLSCWIESINAFFFFLVVIRKEKKYHKLLYSWKYEN